MVELGVFVESFIWSFLATPENNNLGPGSSKTAWDGFLLGFSAGDDELYPFWKEHIGAFHWTPAEAFALGMAQEQTTPHYAFAAEPGPDELTVISWALCQTQITKAANRAQTRFPSEPWARSRVFGQSCNRALHRALVDALTARGHHAVAPALLRQAEERESPTYGRACTWSERHVAYTSGLGTFGLSGGLITERGQAVRLGSVVVHARIPPTPRPYSDPFAYCLFYQDGSCFACADRCPVGSISPQARNKQACARHLEPVTAHFVRMTYGFTGYGCGLCQTGVPCESRNPTAPRRSAKS
jgi:epoxyqueuosine reductase